MWNLGSLHGEFSDQVLYLYIDTYAYDVGLPNMYLYLTFNTFIKLKKIQGTCVYKAQTQALFHLILITQYLTVPTGNYYYY